MDMTYLEKKPIAVLGAGAIGKAIACDCKLADDKKEVRLFDLPPFSEKTLFAVEKAGLTITGEQVNRYGFTRSGKAYIDVVTDDIKKAVAGAGIIFIAVPCIAHDAFFKTLIPALEDGMVINILPDNFGSFKFRKYMKEAGCEKKVIVGGWTEPAFDARVESQGGVTMPRVHLGFRSIYGMGAAFPETDTDDFLEATKYAGYFDSIREGDGFRRPDSILALDLSLANPILHAPSMVLGASVMENFDTVLGGKMEDFSVYSHAFCPSMSKVQYKFYREMVDIAKGFGLTVTDYPEEMFYSRESICGELYMGPEFKIGFNEINHIAWGTGPTSIKSRYMTEDVPVGCHLLHLLGQVAGVKTPVIDSIITLASVMIGENYFETGMTLEAVGLDGMNKEQMVKYALTGEK